MVYIGVHPDLLVSEVLASGLENLLVTYCEF